MEHEDFFSDEEVNGETAEEIIECYDEEESGGCCSTSSHGCSSSHRSSSSHKCCSTSSHGSCSSSSKKCSSSSSSSSSSSHKCSSSSNSLPSSKKSSSSSTTTSHCHCNRTKKEDQIFRVYSYSPNKFPTIPLIWYRFMDRTYVYLLWTDNPQKIREWYGRKIKVSSRITLFNSYSNPMNVIFTLYRYVNQDRDIFEILSTDIQTINGESFATFNVEWKGEFREDPRNVQVTALFTDITCTDALLIGYLETIKNHDLKIYVE
jgi:hypothetical protein